MCIYSCIHALMHMSNIYYTNITYTCIHLSCIYHYVIYAGLTLPMVPKYNATFNNTVPVPGANG